MNEDERSAIEHARQRIRKNHVLRYVADVGLRLTVISTAFTLGGVEGIRRISDPELTSGLGEGAILGARIVQPNKDTRLLEERKAPAARYAAYDFNRAIEFPLSANRKTFSHEREGKLTAFRVQDLTGIGPDERTPRGFVQYLGSVDHLMTYDSYTPQNLVDEGVLVHTSQSEAYEVAGQEQFVGELATRGYADDPVWQVTAKGHGLIFLSGDGGTREPKENRQFEASKVPGLLPVRF